MFCKNCGTQIKDGAVFCHSCGATVSVKSVQNEGAAPEVNAAPTAEQFPTTAEQFPSTPSSNYSAMPQSAMPNYTVGVEDAPKDKGGFAVASLILSIVSLIPCCCVSGICAILGLIFGILGRKSSKSGMATAGIIMSCIAIAFTIIGWIMMIVNGSIESFMTGFNEGFTNGFGGMYY